MGRVPSINLVSVSHGLVHQRRLEAIRKVQVAEWHKWSGWDVLKYLGGRSSSDERSDTWCSQDDAMWTDTWKYSWVDTWDEVPTIASGMYS